MLVDIRAKKANNQFIGLLSCDRVEHQTEDPLHHVFFTESGGVVAVLYGHYDNEYRVFWIDDTSS